MSRNELKKKFRRYKKEFQCDIKILANNNPAFCMAVINTFAAMKHRKHIYEIWWISRNHKKFKDQYDSKLFGKHLCGEETIMSLLYYVSPLLYKKWKGKIPERYAMAGGYNIVIEEIRIMVKKGFFKEIL